MNGYCSFLESYNKELYDAAKSVDNLVFVEPSAALVMARKYVEILVNTILDEQKIDANYLNLKEKIELLLKKGVYKEVAYKHLDHIRLKGNKAAHTSNNESMITALTAHKSLHALSKWYITKYLSEEKAIPDYKEPTPQNKEVNIEEILKMLESRIGNQPLLTPNDGQEPVEDTGDDSHHEYQLREIAKEESFLVREISRLKASSKEALENTEKNHFDMFKRYIHVERSVQIQLEERLEKARSQEKSLILLAGSVGDGKSHLLSYLKHHKPELLEGFHIINDATESDNPHKTSLETLSESLSSFSDNGDGPHNKVIVAINLGVINNFIHHDFGALTFNNIRMFVEKSNLFSDESSVLFFENDFSIINFSAIQPFVLSENQLTSPYFQGIISKITEPTKENPFYMAYLNDQEKSMNSIVHFNYELLSNKSLQNKIDQLLCKSILKDKLVISTRAFLNFLADILLPGEEDLLTTNLAKLKEQDRLQYSLINLLFTRKSRSDVLKSIQTLDPVYSRNVFFDQTISDIYNLKFAKKQIEEYFESDVAIKLFEPIQQQLKITSAEEAPGDQVLKFVTETYIRTFYLTEKIELEQDYVFESYTRCLYAYNKQNNTELNKLYDLVREAVFEWKGTPRKGYVYLNKMNEKFRVAQKLRFEPLRGRKKASMDREMETFETTLTIYVSDDVDNEKEVVKLQVDYLLFALLTKVKNGYRPNNQDREDGLRFVHFIANLLKLGKSKSSLIVHHHENNQFYELKHNRFTSSYVFEKVEK